MPSALWDFQLLHRGPVTGGHFIGIVTALRSVPEIDAASIQVKHYLGKFIISNIIVPEAKSSAARLKWQRDNESRLVKLLERCLPDRRP